MEGAQARMVEVEDMAEIPSEEAEVSLFSVVFVSLLYLPCSCAAAERCTVGISQKRAS